MAVTPELVTWLFNGRSYKVLQGHYGFRQGTDHAGRPSTTVRSQVVTITLDASDEDARLSSYMLDPYLRTSSHLEQRRPDGSVLHRLHIQAAHCVGLRSQFAPADPAGWPGETITLRLTAAALTLDGMTIESHSVLPWDAPEEVRRRARILGDESNMAAARAVAAPKELPKIQAPTAVVPPSLSNNAEKGVYGEHISDTYMRAQGHTKLNDGGLVTPPPPGGTARGNGIDGVWKHGNPPPDYIITEAKYGKSRLGMTKKDGRQMSDTWILGSGRLEKATNKREAAAIRRALFSGRVEKRLHKVDSTGRLEETILL